jgi:hypothetical protein
MLDIKNSSYQILVVFIRNFGLESLMLDIKNSSYPSFIIINKNFKRVNRVYYLIKFMRNPE